MAESAQDARYPASKRRLEQARRDGQVPRSAELTGLAVMAMALGSLVWLSPGAGRELADLAQALWQFDPEAGRSTENTQAMLADGAWALARIVGPLLTLLLCAALLSRPLLGGWVWSTRPITPQLQRLSLADAKERLLAAAAWGRLVVQGAKAVVLFVVAIWLAWTLAPALPALMNGSAGELPAAMLALLTPVGGAMLAAVTVVVAIDVGLQRWLHLRSLRMTEAQRREEARQAGADPQVRSKLKRVALQQGTTPDVAVASQDAMSAAATGLMADAAALIVASAGDDALPTLAVLVRHVVGQRHAVAVVATKMPRVRRLVAGVREARVPVISHTGMAMALAHRAGGESGKLVPAALSQTLRRLVAEQAGFARSADQLHPRTRPVGTQTQRSIGRDMEVPRI